MRQPREPQPLRYVRELKAVLAAQCLIGFLFGFLALTPWFGFRNACVCMPFWLVPAMVALGFWHHLRQTTSVMLWLERRTLGAFFLVQFFVYLFALPRMWVLWQERGTVMVVLSGAIHLVMALAVLLVLGLYSQANPLPPGQPVAEPPPPPPPDEEWEIDGQWDERKQDKPPGST